MDKILTISIAAYNVEKYIRQALDSLVVPEIMEKLEVFVVDDGGTDSTLKIAQEYAQRYPDTFFPIHKKNGGYGSTINTSIELATGKYFRPLDGDDWFDSEELIKIIQLLETIDDDMIVCKHLRCYEGSNRTEVCDQAKGLDYRSYDFEELPDNLWFTMHSVIYKTSILKENEIRLTEHCFYTDQQYDLLPLKWVNTVRIAPNTLYCYRLGRAEQSVGLKGLEKHYQDHDAVRKKLYEEYSVSCPPRTVKEKYIYNYLVKVTASHLACVLAVSYSREHKQEAIQKIAYLKKEYPQFYKAVIRERKSLMVFVASGYTLYPLIHYLRVRKFSSN